MKLEKFLWISVLVFFTSCGTSKKVVENSSKKPQDKEVVRIIEKEPIKNAEEPTITPSSNLEKIEVAPEEISKEKSVIADANAKPDYTQEYINKYASIAVREMHAYKIPASITLAQGVLESGSGRSPLAIKSNNHFGIKCHKGWKGKSVKHDDDALGECFRKYRHPKTSYEDHSKFLTSRSRYANLFKLKLTDYIGWSYGLKKAGYATDKRYPRKLIAIIKKYHLYRYDLVKEGEMQVEDTSVTEHSTIFYEVKKGDTLYSISKRYNTTVQQLKEANGLVSNIISIGQELIIP